MSGERILPEEIRSKGEYFLYLKEVFIYDWCRSLAGTAGLCLDLGCGDGYGTKMLSGSAKKTIGLDIDKTAVESANRKYAGGMCSFQVYDGSIFPLSEDSCDAVIALQVIEHVKNDEKFLREVFRVLKKSGIFVLATPNRLLRLDPGMPPWNIYHFREYSPLELKAVLGAVFADIKIFGLEISGEAKNIEEKRVERNKRIARFDFFNLRRLLPRTVVAPLVGGLNYIFKPGDKAEAKAFDLGAKPGQYYSMKEEQFKDAFDITAICRK
jgi:2-polyprenyl-3-methyl-5-hydroxy-6-metoxy-1,4-benzoquinol methylase